MIQTIHIIAHIDVDGMISHSIAEMYARKNEKRSRHYFVDYQSIIFALDQVSRAIKPNDEVIIADIGFEKELITSFLCHYTNVAEKTSWFDHHKWDDKAVKKARRIVREIIINQDLCASEILQKRYFPDNQFAKMLAYLARAHDFHGKDCEPEAYDHACKIQDVISYGYRKSTIIDQFANGIIWSDEFDTIHKRFREIWPEIISEMARTIAKHSIVLSEGITASIITVFVPSIIESKDMRSYLMDNEERKTDFDALIAVWPSGRIAYEIRDERFFPLIEKINENFKGGGRGLAGGGTYPKRVTLEDYHNCFNRIIEAIETTK